MHRPVGNGPFYACVIGWPGYGHLMPTSSNATTCAANKWIDRALGFWPQGHNAWWQQQRAHFLLLQEAALKDYHDWLEETWAAMKELVKEHLGQEVEYEDILHARALVSA